MGYLAINAGNTSYNTAYGSGALSASNTGSNTAIGYNALTSNNNTQNVAVGGNALSGASNTGTRNTGIGISALSSNSSGSYNTSLGGLSGVSTTTASYEIYIGYYSGYGNTTGSYNTIIGSNSSAVALPATLNNSIMITNGNFAPALFQDSAHNLTLASSAEANSSVYLHGSVEDTLNTQTANYTVTANDHIILCTTNAFTVTLPTAVGIKGREYIIKNGNTTLSGNLITIATTSSQTIDGSAPSTLSALSPLRIFSDGSNWWSW